MMTGTITKWNRLRYKLKRLQRDTGWQLGSNATFLKQPKGARILVYHGICPGDHLRFNTLFVKLSSFEAQLRLYRKYFEMISLDDFYNQRFNKDRFSLCLSFDDGFANNYKYVLPLLEQYEVPAVFFIPAIREAGYDILWNDVLCIASKYGPSSFVFRNEKFTRNTEGKYVSVSTGFYLSDILRAGDFEMKAELIKMFGNYKINVDVDYWLQMTVEQIAELSRSKWVTIGSHGYYHNDLARLTGNLAEQEMIRSKQFLERVTGKEVKALAFPYGSYTKEAIEMAKKNGFTQLLATDFLHPDDPADSVMRERFTVNPFISNINQMHANITGNYK